MGSARWSPPCSSSPGEPSIPKVKTKDMARIIKAVSRGEVSGNLLFLDQKLKNSIEKQTDIPFFKKQVRTPFSRNEKIDPIRIYDYIENDGYLAMAKVLSTGDPHWVVEEVKASGLRGRGGAGFPTGLKWEMLSSASLMGGKFLVCNADEGDPGAYMDRSVLEGNPHQIIEGMIIGAYGTGATEGVVYVRNEYPLAIKHLLIALRQAENLGFWRKDPGVSALSFDIALVRGAGAFVCGEETALIRSIEGKMGEPRQSPPFPVQKGIEQQADSHQQCRDLGKYSAHHRRWSVTPSQRSGRPKRYRNQDIQPCWKDQEHRTGGSPDGNDDS